MAFSPSSTTGHELACISRPSHFTKRAKSVVYHSNGLFIRFVVRHLLTQGAIHTGKPTEHLTGRTFIYLDYQLTKERSAQRGVDMDGDLAVYDPKKDSVKARHPRIGDRLDILLANTDVEFTGNVLYPPPELHCTVAGVFPGRSTAIGTGLVKMEIPIADLAGYDICASVTQPATARKRKRELDHDDV